MARAGAQLVVNCLSPKLSSVVMNHSFVPRKWCHIVLTHSTGNALTSPMLRLYVNGLLEASARFKYPKVRFTKTRKV